MSEQSISGIKGFDKDLKCLGMQYKVGDTFEIPDGKKLKCCPNNDTEAGLHFVENPIDVFGYYPPSESRYCLVEGSGELQRVGSDSEVASSKLHISTEISLKNLLDLSVKFILDKVNWSDDKKSNTGYRSAATNTGNQSAATNTGNRSAATNTGNRSAATNTGDQSAATNTGNQSAATNTGNQSAATNTGNQSAATVNGSESVAISIGIEGKAKAALGGFIVMAEWKQDENYTWHRIDVKSFLVDGEDIKADTFYILKNGLAIAK